MSVEILHKGFDGLKVANEAFVPPEIAKQLFAAKEEANASRRDVPVTIGEIEFAVRRSGGQGISAHTGEYGAEFRILNPDAPAGFEPGIAVDFRAFFLATEGLDGAKKYFDRLMEALQIDFEQKQVRVCRVDFAVDLHAPWFEPDPDSVILPARTPKRAFMEKDTKEKFWANTVVTGVTGGKSNNRQLVIYDKRAEVMAKNKPGWKTIWDHSRAANGNPPLDLSDRDQSRVWRFETRVGPKHLRHRWEIRGWADLDAMIGDVFVELATKLRYSVPQPDTNRSRWPDHPFWALIQDVYSSDLAQFRSGVCPDNVRTVNREEHKEWLDKHILGLLVSRAAMDGVSAERFDTYLQGQIFRLDRISKQHPISIEKRIKNAASRYRFK